MNTRDVLTAAAHLAAVAATAERAAIIANYVCRADEQYRADALTAWRKAERFTGLDGAFVYHVSQHTGPGAVAAGLFRAARAGLPAEPEDRFTNMTRDELLGEARRWFRNAQHWETQHDAIRDGDSAFTADAVTRLERAKGLLNAQRKTVPMGALRDALLGEDQP